MPITNDIVTVAIYPAIGIARVGNSPEEFFFGPEVPGPHPVDPSNFRDEQGRIKRQAQRFRLYGLNAGGEIVREITANDGEITWTVHVANKKASWYQFKLALDIPAAKGELAGSVAIGCLRRNRTLVGVQRKQLVIDPGPRSIQGANVNRTGGNAQYAFDTGKFFGKPVYLGELRTDAQGHLLFLGGRGAAAARQGEPLTTFANNEGWHDDIADGPVDATVRLKNGQMLSATGAWIVVGPPNYAPGVPAIVTGYDLLYEVAAKLNPALKPARPSFYQHIYPLLERFTVNQWVNGGFARDFGWGSLSDFTRADLLAQLNNPSLLSRPLRQNIFNRFRDPSYTVKQPEALPHFYGDGASFNPATRDPREWMAVLDLQYAWLRQWAAGDFVVDSPPPALQWESMSPAEQANGLTRAALEETTAGPFHPGCEFTWPLRLPIMYAAPFRLKRRAKAEGDYGAQLNSAIALKKGGPLDGSAAGDITRWMAVPWQSDTSSCLSAYPGTAFLRDYIPTFWPARVPNDVMTEENYQILIDPNRTPAEKEAAFSIDARRKWLRGIAYTNVNAPRPALVRNVQAINTFIKVWDQVAIVAQLPGPDQGGLLPATVWAETGRSYGQARSRAGTALAAADQAPAETPLEEDALWATQPPILFR